MKTLRLILGDQLSRQISSLRDLDARSDIVLMVEVHDETVYVRHHRQKIALTLSAMRHFARSLREEGVTVDYVTLDAPGNAGSFTGELRRAVQRHAPDRVAVTEPGEWRVWEQMRQWQTLCGVPVEIREDDRFLCSRQEFAQWAGSRRQLRMENFYRYMRRKTGWLMRDGQPEGGQWNYDRQNRKPLPRNIALPPPYRFAPDAVTRETLALVADRFSDHFGELEPFGWGVARTQALQALDRFLSGSLPFFGDYQDAMRSGETFLFHSALSPYLNLGLLLPAEVCLGALEAYRRGTAPLHAVEGFLRQIVGWREYVRGIYWLKMPAYRETNYFQADRPLPSFYWTGDTDMRCLKEAIETTRRHAYAHHIQRLMVTGNFALLAGIAPQEVEEWYLIVYADAYEWVELPNTHGMALHADGGVLGSKPYAASGAYIDRMSDYCSRCVYDPKARTGPDACPFNYLYWNFLMAHEIRLKPNPRMSLPYQSLARLSLEERERIRRQAEAFLSSLSPSRLPEGQDAG